MKAVLVLTYLLLAACGAGSGGSSGGATSAAPSDPAVPQTTCADLDGTDWVIQGNPTLTVESADQAGQAPYIASFSSNGTFTENQYVSSNQTMTCTRTLSSAVITGDDYQYPIGGIGDCFGVATEIKVDTSVCNQLTVTVLDGMEGTYETAVYVPN